MKTLLAATDFSEAGNNAFTYAAHLAFALKAKLVLLHVGQIEGNTPEIPQMLLSWEAVELSARDRMHHLRDKVKKEIGEIEIECRYRLGNASDEILLKAKKEHADLIVVGMEGEGGFLERLIGSVATELGRKANLPVLIIPKTAHFQEIHKIVLGTDLGMVSEQGTLQPIKTLAHHFDSKIFVLNVRKSLEEVPTEVEVSGSIEMDVFLKGVKHIKDFKESEEVEDGIHSYAEENKVQLISVIAHTHSFWYRLTHETHTHKLAFESKIPLLILH
jgi:nucleotide-binding universal stress UspA family protein